MKWKNVLLATLTTFLLVVSVSSAYYKTVMLQDFDITGIWIEFTSEKSTYIFFVYENIQYELELDTIDYNLILLSISNEVNRPVSNMNDDFIEDLLLTYQEAMSAN